MNKPSERIQAALLRSRATSPAAPLQQVATRSTQTAPLIVVEERNLAALLRLNVNGHADSSDRSLADTPPVSEHQHLRLEPVQRQEMPECSRPAVFTRS
jgi:hypothetical protein